MLLLHTLRRGKAHATKKRGGSGVREDPEPDLRTWRYGDGDDGQLACCVAWISRLILIWSLTSTPPASSAWFQVSPNSLRLIAVVAVKPTRWPPHGSVPLPTSSASSETSWVTPRMVRSPTRTKRLRPCGTTPVERKAIVGKLSMSRKSAERRWPSRWGSPVSMLAAPISALTDEEPRLASSRAMVPATFAKRPLTVENIMCLTASSTTEWEGSIAQVVAAAVVDGVAVDIVGLLLLLMVCREVGVCNAPLDRRRAVAR